jgi:hypothetical protein
MDSLEEFIGKNLLADAKILTGGGPQSFRKNS